MLVLFWKALEHACIANGVCICLYLGLLREAFLEALGFDVRMTDEDDMMFICLLCIGSWLCLSE